MSARPPEPAFARWDEVERVFGTALELTPAERARLLASGIDDAVRAEVERLLARHERLEAAVDADPLARLDARRAAGLLSEERRPGDTIGRYRVVRRLGGGSMGTVYLAEDSPLARLVAVKVLAPHLDADDDATRRFREEARLASAVEHPNVAAVHEIGDTADGRLYIAMAWCQGGSLRARLARGPLPVDEAWRTLQGLAAGLAAVHAHGIVHRDVKPENILFGADGGVRLADFGIARAAGQQLTRTGATLGTAAYMSPEQTRGETVDARSDVWSVGIVMYETLTGRRPFEADAGEALVYAIRHDEPAPITRHRRDVPAWLARLAMQCLRKHPSARPGGADVIARALAEGRYRGEGAGWPPSRRGRIAATVVGVMTVTAVAFAPGREAPHGAPPHGAPPHGAPPATPASASPAPARTTDPVVLDLYMKGLALIRDRRPASRQLAGEHFREAIARDSTFARAWVGLAQVYTGSNSGTAAARHERARPLLQRALALDPALAMAHRQAAWTALLHDRDYAAAERGLLRAIALDSADASNHHAYAAWLAIVGRVDESLALTQRVAALDPSSALTTMHLGLHLYWRGRIAESIAVLERAVEIDSSFRRTFMALGRSLTVAGRHDDAIRALSREGLEYATFDPDAILAYAYGRAGRSADAQRIIARFEARARVGYVPVPDLVAAHLGVGDLDRAMDWLERLPDDRGAFVFLLADAIFDPLRGSPRYDAVVERMGLGDAARRHAAARAASPR